MLVVPESNYWVLNYNKLGLSCAKLCSAEAVFLLASGQVYYAEAPICNHYNYCKFQSQVQTSVLELGVDFVLPLSQQQEQEQEQEEPPQKYLTGV